MVYRLVVIAGDNDILRMLPEQLGDTAVVTMLETANDALWEVRDDPPEAMIAAVELPGMSGLEMAEILPNFEIPTRVILWSQTVDDAARAQAEDYGVYRFLQGDLSVAELQDTIEAAAADALAAVVELEPEVAEPEPEPEVAEPEPEPPAETSAELEVAEPEPASESTVVPERTKPRRSFIPARVTLPSAASSVPPPPPSTPRGGLASRTRAAAERSSGTSSGLNPSFTSGDGPMNRRSGTMVMTADNLKPVRSAMSQLAQDLGAQSIMLTDRAGLVLVEVGTAGNLPMMLVLPLLSTSFSTAGEVSRQLGEQDATTLYIHEGVNYDLYCFNVAQEFLLVLVFNKKVASSKIGAVWVNAKRAIRELRDMLV